MFDNLNERELEREYEEKVHQSAEANLLKKISQVNGNQASILTHLLHLLRRPQDRLKQEMAPKK